MDIGNWPEYEALRERLHAAYPGRKRFLTVSIDGCCSVTESFEGQEEPEISGNPSSIDDSLYGKFDR